MQVQDTITFILIGFSLYETIFNYLEIYQDHELELILKKISL